MGTVDDPDYSSSEMDTVTILIAEHEKDDLFNKTVKERDELKAAVEQLTKAGDELSATIVQQAAVIERYKEALADTTGYVLTLAKAMGKVMP